MKRLFKVVRQGDPLATPHGERDYFDSKVKAKEVRNALNGSKGTGVYKVTYGPDHRNYKR